MGAQAYLRSVATAERDKVFQDLTFREGEDLLLDCLHFACHSAKNQGKRTLTFEGNAIVPRKLDAVISELDILLCSEPFEASPEEVSMAR